MWNIMYAIEDKGKVVPVHAIKANGGWKVSLHYVLTSALYGGKRPASHSGSFTPEKVPPMCNEQEIESAPQQVWTFRRTEKCLASGGNRSQVLGCLAQLVV
jgi:hypothetical protein